MPAAPNRKGSALGPDPTLELVPAVPEAASVRIPEELLLPRMLEVVRDRVEALDAGQRAKSDELREIKASLPMQRRRRG